MVISMAIIGCSIIYTVIIMFLYFSKKKIVSFETSIYGVLLILTLVNMIIEFNLCLNVLLKFDVNSFYNLFLNRLFLITMFSWVTVFTAYIYRISFGNHSKYQKIFSLKGKGYHFFGVFILIAIILLLVLPFNQFVDDTFSYSYGAGPNAVIVFYIIYFISWFIALIFRTNRQTYYKYASLFLFVAFSGVALILRQIAPGVLLNSLPFSFAALLLYFTIENPDLKMLNEVKLAKEEAENANRAKTDFLSSMSHEIRTPLNAIIAFSEEILKEDDLASAKSDAEQVINSSKILLETIGGILDISKIEAGSLEINRVEYNPRELFKSITDLINIKMKEKNLNFSMTLPADLPLNLYGDKVNLQKIIMNLLTNANKYTEEGEVKFNVSCINYKKSCTLILAVEDTGRGIKEENIEKLFTKFSRLDEDRNTTIEGTGLGLAITKKLVELMNGKITVQSIYGSGSKFTVILSQKIRHSKENIETKNLKEEPQDPLNIKCRDFSNKTILVTDDNEINLKVAVKLLEKYNLNIVKSPSGDDTLNKIKHGNKYDLLLLDIEMPRMNGVKVLENLRNINFKTPIVALTANATSGDREKYLNLGFNEYLAKPIDRLELDRILNLFLSCGTESFVTNKITTNEMDNPKYNLNYLKINGAQTDKAISILGDIDMYNETIEIVFESTPNRLKRLEEYKNNKDMKSYSIEVHALKSDLKYIGFYELSEIPFNHEKESKKNNIAYVEQNFENLKTNIINILRICKKYLNK